MKQKLQECGVRVPIFMGINKCVSFDSLAQSLGLPMIIKPINSAGTNSVFIVSTAQEYQNTINLINNKAEKYQAEEFIDGTLYHCDIALVQNRVVFAQCTRYLASTIQFQNGIPLGGQFIANDEAIHPQLVAFTILSISSLGAKDGVFHTEIFEKIDGTLVFLESGHRPAGMLVNRMYELATGVNLLNIDIRIQARIALNDFAQVQKLSQAFYLMYPKRTGLVDGINELMIPNEVVASYHCIAKTGDVHSGCHSNLDYIASVVSSGKGEVFEKFYERMANFQPVIYKQ